MTRSIDKSFVAKLLLIALACCLAGHAFCYFNLSLRGESLMLNAEKAGGAAISQGQFLRSFYLRIRGSIASPFLIGMLSFLYLFGAELILAELLQIRDLPSQCILSGILFFFPTLLEINVGSLYLADIPCLAFLLIVGAYALLTYSFRCFPVSYLLLTAAYGLSLDLFILFFCIMLLHTVSVIMSHESSRKFSWKETVLSVVISLMALLTAIAGAWFFSRHSGNDLEIDLLPADGRSFLSSIFNPTLSLFTGVTNYPHLLILLRYFFLILSTYALWASRSLPLTVAALCLWLLPSLPVLGTSVSQFPICTLFLELLPFILIRSVWQKKVLRRIILSAYAILFTGYLIFANQAYLRVNLDFDTSLSLMTQVISRLEERDDFKPGDTPVAFVGSPSGSPLVMEREGFEHLSALNVLRGNTSLTSRSQTTWYFWETLGYPMNCISEFEQEKLAVFDEVMEMPVFPASKSIRKIGDVLVVRLSE
ncbi:MAG: hypothetical protein IJ242_03645 [Clostridia bacterium]|nr:hypothetical protein [Clostridia bacterium]